MFSKRVQGRSVIVWGATSNKEEVKLIKIDGRMDWNYYIKVLQSCLVPVAEALFGG